MQSDAERTLGNLHVLAVLSQNDKLLTNGDTFDIYSPTTLRAVWRFWHGEGRAANVQRVRICVRAAMDFVSKFMEDTTALAKSADGNVSPSTEVTTYVLTVPDSAQVRIETVAMQHVRMLTALRSALGGLRNLLQTYRDDPALASQINLIINEVNDFVNVMEPHSVALRRRYVVHAVSEGIAHRSPTP